jgi:hypothetical protein
MDESPALDELGEILDEADLATVIGHTGDDRVTLVLHMRDGSLRQYPYPPTLASLDAIAQMVEEHHVPADAA